MAEAGVGKSRLLFEFKASLAIGLDGARDVLGVAWQGERLSAGDRPAARLFRDRRGRRRRRAPRKGTGESAERWIARLEDTLPYLFALLGIVEGDDPLAQMDAQIKKRRTLEAIKRILLRES